jgi:hypothetical protein
MATVLVPLRVSARWPGDAYRFARKLIDRLPAPR